LAAIRSTLAESVSSASALAAEFGAVLYELLEREVLLILDDVHELEGSRAAELIDGLIRHAPSGLRFVLAGRGEPPVRLARLRAAGLVADLGAADLAFTRAETAAVMESSVPGLAPDLIDGVHAATAGWPVAVRLVAESIRDTGPAEVRMVLDRLNRPGGTLFSYLAEEVLSAEVPEDRRLLELAAVVGGIDAELCTALGISDAHLRLARLERRGVYFDRLGDQLLMTPLVAGHLGVESTIDDRARRDALEIAASVHREARRFPEALELISRIGDAGALASMIATHGRDLIDAGAARALIDAVTSLPAESRTPEIERLQGEALHAIGEWDRALEIYERLASGATILDPALAWRMGLIHHLRGQLVEALAVYERGSLDGDAGDVAMLLSWWASAVWLTADHDRCRELAAQGLSFARESRDDRALGAAHTVMAMLAALDGDRVGNDAHYLRALEHAERAGDIWQQMRIHANRGSRHQEEANYAESVDETEQALRLAELTDDVVFKALALLNRGQARLHMGSIDVAAGDFENARQLWEGLGARQAAYALVGLGDVHRARGDRAQAAAAYRRAVEISEPVGDTQGLVPALSGLAIVTAADDPGQAISLAERAVSHGATLGVVDAHLALGRALLAAGENDRAGAAAAAAAELAGARRDRAGLAEALELGFEAAPGDTSGPLDEAIALWRAIGDPVGVARNRLLRAKLLGADVDEITAIAEGVGRLGARGLATEGRRLAEELSRGRTPAVRVRMLGGFAVEVAGVAVSANAWQSKKARDVLKILVGRRGRPIHREELIEILWPDDDPAKTSNRLSVALSTVRSILDPGGAPSADRFLVADRSSVGLNRDEIEVDVERFLADADAGLSRLERGEVAEARHVLERAEEAYLGDFLQEDPYEEWAMPLRDEARTVFLAVARALASIAEADGDEAAAARHHLRVLAVDAYDEASHLGLVASMARAGHHGEARRLYRHYADRMEELNMEPAAFPAV
jgi:DNA-binding SARP family transcriptional activator/tetratricopeptide (TPR) repeat protein